jgi:hypothetical protein
VSDFYDLFTDDDFGTDFDLVAGDLTVDSTLDVTALNGFDYVDQMVRRRLSTPRGALRAWVQDVEGLKEVQATYGNGAFRYKSEPMTASVVNSIRDELVLCLSEEPLVADVAIGISIQTAAGVAVPVYDVRYTVRATGDSRSVRVERDADGFTLN